MGVKHSKDSNKEKVKTTDDKIIDVSNYPNDTSSIKDEAAKKWVQDINMAWYKRFVEHKECKYPKDSNDDKYYWSDATFRSIGGNLGFGSTMYGCKVLHCKKHNEPIFQS